jgi:hypothetical protein
VSPHTLRQIPLHALGERCRHIADQLGVELRPWLKRGAQRIDHTGVGLGAVQDGLYDTRVELRFGKNASDALTRDAALDLGNSRWARVRGVPERDRAGGREIEVGFEILVGVVEHDEAAATDGVENAVHFGDQRLHLLARGGGVGEVGSGIVGIGGR